MPLCTWAWITIANWSYRRKNRRGTFIENLLGGDGGQEGFERKGFSSTAENPLQSSGHRLKILAPKIMAITNSARKIKNNTLAMSAAPSAIPPNPNAAAMIAIMKKITDQRNIVLNFDSTSSNPAFHTFHADLSIKSLCQRRRNLWCQSLSSAVGLSRLPSLLNLYVFSFPDARISMV